MAEEAKGQGENFVGKFEKEADTKVKDEDLTLGQFIDRHSLSSEAKDALRDLNNNQICDRLGITSAELVEIQRELGHKLPEGAN